MGARSDWVCCIVGLLVREGERVGIIIEKESGRRRGVGEEPEGCAGVCENAVWIGESAGEGSLVDGWGVNESILGTAIDGSRLLRLIFRLFDFLEVNDDRPSDSSAESSRKDVLDETALGLLFRV